MAPRQHDPVRVALDFRVKPGAGIARYVENLQRAVTLGHPEIETLLYRRELPETLRRVRALRSGMRMADEWLGMARDLKAQNVDVFHCTKNIGVPVTKSLPVVTTIQDIIPLALADIYSPTRVQRELYYFNLRQTLTISSVLIAISAFSRDELLRYFPGCRNKVHCIPLGCDPDFSRGMTRARAWEIMHDFGVRRPFILTMGGAEPRKNVNMLLKLHGQAQDMFAWDLVIIGGAWRGKNLAVDASRSESVFELRGLSEEALAAAYTAADVFVFPSLYEGFGLPVLEAMACGVPVLAHDGSSMPEVACEAAMLVDMHSASACLSGLMRLLKDRELRQDLIAAGRERVRLFSWNVTAAKTVEIYQYLSSSR